MADATPDNREGQGVAGKAAAWRAAGAMSGRRLRGCGECATSRYLERTQPNLGFGENRIAQTGV